MNTHAQYPLVFAFIADWAKVDTDIAVKAFYDNHCDIVNACLHLELCTNQGCEAAANILAQEAAAAAAAAAMPTKPKPMKWLAAKLKRLFCCCCSSAADMSDGANWSVTCPSPTYWEEGDFDEFN